jgi:hypothetical protein
MNRRTIGRGVLGAGLALLLTGVAASSAVAAPVKWLPVPLGTHRFGHLSTPEAIVAKAGPHEVGFELPPNGEGPSFGPWSFDVASDGSVWLMDEFNDRLLVWSPGHARHPRIVRLPMQGAVEFALGRGDTMYVFAKSAGDPGYLYSMTEAGKIRWKERTIVDIFNSQLRMGPDGTLYYYFPSPPDEVGGWVPVATPGGRPVSLAEQRRRASRLQPMPGGLRLASNDISNHRKEFSLLDKAGDVVRAWRVTSRSTLWLTLTTTGMLGRDLVATVDVTREIGPKHLHEHLILRMGSAGETRARLALDPHVISGVDVPITDLRVGPDGHFYQLRVSPETGVSIARYSLDAKQVATEPTPTSASVAPPAPTPTTAEPSPAATMAQPTSRIAQVASPSAAEPSGVAVGAQATSRASRTIPGLAAVSACALLGVGLYVLHRWRSRAGLRAPG